MARIGTTINSCITNDLFWIFFVLSTMSQRQWTVLVLWFAAVLGVAGQSSNVIQCIASYDWSINSLGQTPCFVAANLESLCGNPTSVDAIPPMTHYLPPIPAEANQCRCNTVTYSMMSACGCCQNRTFTDWTTWSTNCTSSTLMNFPNPIPTSIDIVVPTWAYLNLALTNNTFSPLAAEQNATNTPSSISSSTTSTSTSFSPSSSAPSRTPASAGKSQSDAGAIAGGVVGGLALLAVIGLSLLWFFLHKRRNAIQKDLSFDSRALVSGYPTSQTTGLMNGPSAAFSSQSIYTSDMSTFPGSPLTTSGVFTSGIPPSRRSLESLSLSVVQLGPPVHGVTPTQRGYTGMPEI